MNNNDKIAVKTQWEIFDLFEFGQAKRLVKETLAKKTI